MRRNKLSYVVKATIRDMIVALLIMVLLIFTIDLFLGQEINSVFGILNTVAIKTENKEVVQNIQTTLNKEEKKIINYPEYGTQYATIEISKINVNLPVYYGDTLEILKKGVGHSSGSYFPGEGGSIIFMGHNSKNVFRRFSELKIGDEIKVTTTYGEYKYKIYDMQIVEENESYKLPIKNDKEVLMVYTCYPFNNIGYTKQRFVVYSEIME